MAKLENFQDVVSGLNPNETHLIVGNGFSRACFDQVFNYTSLLSLADFKDLSPYISVVFSNIGTADFEKVIQILQESAQTAATYNTTDRQLLTDLESDANGLREALIEAISNHHPENPPSLNQRQYTKCKTF
ncbi:MAG: DUF4917 family protein, partial [Dehalococcoidia bacterium]